MGPIQSRLTKTREADIMLLSDASPMSTVTACILPSCCLFTRLSSAEAQHVVQAFRWRRTSKVWMLALPLHVVTTPRYRSKVYIVQSSSRQPSEQTVHREKLIFSLSAYYCRKGVAFPGAPRRKRPLKGAAPPQRSSLCSHRHYLCEK